jgi:hypothetical protein
MNDNIRYISLQYIKGNNYEEITCFNYDVIRDILDNDENFKDISTYTLNELKEAISDEKCYIGESFLNDLVNYYNFKDIKKKIEHAKRIINDYKDKLRNKNNDSDVEKAAKTKRDQRFELINILGVLINGLKDKKYNNDNIGNDLNNKGMDDEIKIKFNEFKTLINAYIFYGSKNIGTPPLKDIPNNFTNPVENPIKSIIEKIKEKKEENPPNLQSISNEIIDGMNIIMSSEKGTKYDFIKLLGTLNKLLIYEEKQEGLKGKTDIKNADDLLDLFKIYIKICNRNIDKYDNIFKYNDISNIDEAFMIESYSKFLKKLNKLKENLESKDKGKLERALTNTLEKLFNLYGINDYQKIIKGDDGINETPEQKYFKNQIFNY